MFSTRQVLVCIQCFLSFIILLTMLCGFLFHSLDLELGWIFFRMHFGGQWNWWLAMERNGKEWDLLHVLHAWIGSYYEISLCNFHTMFSIAIQCWLMFIFFLLFIFIYRRLGFFFVCTATNSNMVFGEHEFSSVTSFFFHLTNSKPNMHRG